ncbi:lysozyme inhibitor LprI family protein [Legionella jordanis]|uniref:Lysozyme inhibitor LprI-like N-terminal domain-containing protein n=1 Tax=Legionella jordanis TaxID=456 RepID=A0A0W0VA79_9GAMM|nr:lysozyme inhibitor LprI family protein [Legionella jordanis]KTD17041.1 hypothetical protein Ljor_1347 [Legionella jordanis]RMX03177.1 DUF1311 domain-containing protein [Legionella jordanis]RMX18684.1 DUF1311 domain-containing protein [Legionella jordanis]VEH12763.1 Uncharacterized protein conserved in bacteria [Legionella jordanis]
MDKKKILCLSALISISTTAFAEFPVCQSNEQILFACTTKNNKIISLCAPAELSLHSVVRYHFGQAGKPEFSYPANALPASKAFTGRAQMFSGGGGIYLRFHNRGYDYILYNGVGKGWKVSGVVVLNQGQFMSYQACTTEPTSELSPDVLEKLSIPLDSDEHEFFPGDIPELAQGSDSKSQNEPSLKAIKTCYDKALSVMDIKICANREYGFYDDLLNKQYQKLMNLLPAEKRELLIDTQRAWLTYRQKQCNFLSLQHEGGTMEPVDLIQCYISLDKDRIEALNHFMTSYQKGL